MVDGSKDAALHQRQVAIAGEVSGPEAAKVVMGAVKNMAAGLPRVDNYEEMDKQALEDGANKPNKLEKRKAISELEPEPGSGEDWLSKLNKDVRALKKLKFQLEEEKPKHWEHFASSMADNATGLKEFIDNLEHCMISTPDDNNKVVEITSAAKDKVKECHEDMVAVGRLLGIDEAPATPSTTRKRKAA